MRLGHRAPIQAFRPQQVAQPRVQPIFQPVSGSVSTVRCARPKRPVPQVSPVFGNFMASLTGEDMNLFARVMSIYPERVREPFISTVRKLSQPHRRGKEGNMYQYVLTTVLGRVTEAVGFVYTYQRVLDWLEREHPDLGRAQVLAESELAVQKVGEYNCFADALAGFFRSGKFRNFHGSRIHPPRGIRGTFYMGAEIEVKAGNGSGVGEAMGQFQLRQREYWEKDGLMIVKEGPFRGKWLVYPLGQNYQWVMGPFEDLVKHHPPRGELPYDYFGVDRRRLDSISRKIVEAAFPESRRFIS